ncbi:VanZ family protein [Paenibacillus sp. sgz302251]|uniref:VanZ family protein n=1 Tax=Paenibacillus sp. sgz302251 TaxID=3414493 RepID=UPI003C7C25F4
MKQTEPANQAPFRYVRLLRFLPAVGWMTVIFMLSSRTGDEISTILPYFQKLFPLMTDFNWGHFVSYFILAVTIDYGIGARADRFWMKVMIIVICGFYGVTDEYHQTFVGGRMMDPLDVRNDMIGAAIWTAVSALPPIRKMWRRIAP